MSAADHLDSEERSPSTERGSTPNGLNSTNAAQHPNERLSNFDSPVIAGNFDQQHQLPLNIKFNPY